MRTDDGCLLISLQSVLARAILVAVFMFLPDGQRRDLIKENLGKMGFRDKKKGAVLFREG